MKASDINESHTVRNEKGQFFKGCVGMRRTHGLSGTRFQKVFYDMKRRCENPTDTHYKWYGDKGIKVMWPDFESFRVDMYNDWVAHVKSFGEKQTQIDRIDSNGNYCKENCRWVTCSQQQRNRSTNKLITFNGKTRTAVEWGEITGITGHEVRKRIYRGWSIERTLTQPNLGVGKYVRKNI